MKQVFDFGSSIKYPLSFLNFSPYFRVHKSNKMKNLFVLILIAFCWSCGNDAAQDAAARLALPLPNTPETVTRKWQEYVDTDKFDEAL